MILKISNSDDFERLLDALAADVLDAGYHLQLRMALAEATNEYLVQFNQSLAFWHLTFNAQNAAAMVLLCRAYDQHPASLSLINFLDTVKENLTLFGATAGPDIPPAVDPSAARPDLRQLDEDRRSVSPENDLVKRLISLRGNVFIHRKASNTVERQGLETRYAFTFVELEQLWRRAINILNRYSQLFRRQVWTTSLVGQDDYLSLLKALRRDHDHQEALIRAELHELEPSEGEKPAT